jgi:hypothetical protein
MVWLQGSLSVLAKSFPRVVGGNPAPDQRNLPNITLDARLLHSGMTFQLA